MKDNYSTRVDSQIAQYTNRSEQLHATSSARDYWYSRFVKPKALIAQVIDKEKGFYCFWLSKLLQQRPGDPLRILSVGCGDVKNEIEIISRIQTEAEGLDRKIVLSLCDLNESLVAKGAAALRGRLPRVETHIIVGDINSTFPPGRYDVVIAHQCLHHFVKLEQIFTNIAACLVADGLFLSSDVIGRNGHRLWPEIRAVIDELWPTIPERLRYNNQLKRTFLEFPDIDCAKHGFEGIRAEDIMPLLLEVFSFRAFFSYGGLSDNFVGRAYGPNFQLDKEQDKHLLDEIAFASDCMLAGRMTSPTRMMSVMVPRRPSGGSETLVYATRTPGNACRSQFRDH